MQIRIYYEDTDCGGIVYHSKYLNFCERARSEIFFSHGISPHSVDSFFVVKKIEANFIASAIFGDILEVQTKLLELKNVSLTIEQNILRDKKVIFSAIVTLAFLQDKKPTKIPQQFKDIFESL